MIKLDIMIERKWLTAFSLGYIYIPIFLFLLGWTRPAIASLTIIACIFCLYKFWKHDIDIKESFSVDSIVMIFAIVLFILIGYYAGYGRFVDQAYDWEKHNAILNDLVQRRWPVLYSNAGENSMLTYYIGQYMVPAALGKITHSMRISEIILYMWNIGGLILVFMNICAFTKADSFMKQFIYVLMIPFFSIPLLCSEILLKWMTGINRIGEGQWFYNADGIMIQYSNNYTLLRWVFPQVIAIWLIVIVFLQNKDKIRYYVFMLLPSIIFGTLTFIGLLPLAIAASLENVYRTKNIKEWLQEALGLENILMSLTLGVLLFFYFLGNVTSDKPADVEFSIMPYTRDTIVVYFCFIIANILIYALILFKHNKNDWIYYTCIITLIVLPLFRMGIWNDLTMRASIPALFILMIYVVKTLYASINDYSRNQMIVSSRLKAFIIIAFLLVGMCYPFAELAGSVLNENYLSLGSGNEWESLELYANCFLQVQIPEICRQKWRKLHLRFGESCRLPGRVAYALQEQHCRHIIELTSIAAYAPGDQRCFCRSC